MPDIIIKEVATTRFVGVTQAAKKLHVTQQHLTMCLRGERRLSADKARRIKIIREDSSHAGAGA